MAGVGPKLDPGPSGFRHGGRRLADVQRPADPLARNGRSSALLIFGLHGRPLQTQVDFLAIGQGDGALIQLPDGRTILVDAGPPGAQPLFWLRRQGITHIDEVVISPSPS